MLSLRSKNRHLLDQWWSYSGQLWLSDRKLRIQINRHGQLPSRGICIYYHRYCWGKVCDGNFRDDFGGSVSNDYTDNHPTRFIRRLNLHSKSSLDWPNLEYRQFDHKDHRRQLWSAHCRILQRWFWHDLTWLGYFLGRQNNFRCLQLGKSVHGISWKEGYVPNQVPRLPHALPTQPCDFDWSFRYYDYWPMWQSCGRYCINAKCTRVHSYAALFHILGSGLPFKPSLVCDYVYIYDHRCSRWWCSDIWLRNQNLHVQSNWQP